MNEKIKQALTGIRLTEPSQGRAKYLGREPLETAEIVALTLEGAAEMARKEAEELYANLELFAEELESLAATIRAGEGQ
jgi:hypothetical protein